MNKNSIYEIVLGILCFITNTISHTEPQAFESKDADLQTESLLKKVHRCWRAYTRCLKGSKDCSKHKTYIARALTGLAAVAPITYGIHYTNPTFYQTLKTALSKNAAQSISFPSTSKSVGTVPDTIKNMIDTELTQNKTIDEMVTKYEFSEDDGAIRFLINPNYAVLDNDGNIKIDNKGNQKWKKLKDLSTFDTFIQKIKEQANLSEVSAHFDQTISKKIEEKKDSDLQAELKAEIEAKNVSYVDVPNDDSIKAYLLSNPNFNEIVASYFYSSENGHLFVIKKQYCIDENKLTSDANYLFIKLKIYLSKKGIDPKNISYICSKYDNYKDEINEGKVVRNIKNRYLNIVTNAKVDYHKSFTAPYILIILKKNADANSVAAMLKTLKSQNPTWAFDTQEEKEEEEQ